MLRKVCQLISTYKEVTTATFHSFSKYEIVQTLFTKCIFFVRVFTNIYHFRMMDHSMCDSESLQVIHIQPEPI